MMMIKCQKCHRRLPLDAFFRRRSTLNGRQRWCKDCSNSAVREHRAQKAAAAARPMSDVLSAVSGGRIDFGFIADLADLVPEFG